LFPDGRTARIFAKIILMTLTTHAVVGVAAARLFPQMPVTAFLAGFCSHFLIDAIPHWDYHLRSAKYDVSNPLNNDMIIGSDFVFDLSKILFDFIFAYWLSFWIFSGDSRGVIFVGASAGMLPDALQFAYFKIRREPLISLQRFHQWIHTGKKLREQWIFGIVSQIMLSAAIIFLSFAIK